MEVDDQIRSKFPRIYNGNGGVGSTKLGHTRKMDDQNPDEEDEGDNRRGIAAAASVRGGGVDLGGGIGRFYGWPSSRIVRVSRASGGKDRHSKVLTSKGLRDRRVRLSVNTAIQFYDLQDRLGYDQPSKAVEWLLKAADSSIAELPPMNTPPFPDTPKKLSDDKRSSIAGSDRLGFDSAVNSDGGDRNYSLQHATKSSACSSASDTSKGSGLSLSRSESRVKARERAKERVAEKENESTHLNPVSHATSFTELLNGVGNGINNVSNKKASPPSTPMDYFSSGLLAPPSSARSGPLHLPANPFMASPLFRQSAGHHPELQQYSFVPDHFVPVVNAAAANYSQHHPNVDYNLNFTISSSANSSGVAGFNRGTLQSNSSSQSLLPHNQRYSDGPAPSFFIGSAESHHQFLPGYDSRGLQLCYGDAHGNTGKHSTQRGKGKN